MSDKKSQCPYCNGKHFIGTGYEEKVVNGRRTLYPYAQPCYCDLNIAIGNKFGMLSTLPDATPQDSKTVYDRYSPKSKNKGNYIFYGDEQVFLYTVKCYLLKGFTHQNYELIEGGGIVNKYNMPDSEGNRLSIEALDQYDLVAILFTSRSEPPTLKACVADVVKNRLRINRPTWIYAVERKLDSTKEFSKDLSVFLEEFEYVESAAATNYTGFSKVESDKVRLHKAQDIQAELGGL